MGFLAALFLGIAVVVAALILSETSKTKDSGTSDPNKDLSGQSRFSGDHGDTGHCNGDCDSCPAHYGYRYGRWYYGHGHQRGCQRGGNGGASGRTYRD